MTRKLETVDTVRERERERESYTLVKESVVLSNCLIHTVNNYIKNSEGYKAFSLNIKNKLLAMCIYAWQISLFFVFTKELYLRGLHLHNTIVKYI